MVVAPRLPQRPAERLAINAYRSFCGAERVHEIAPAVVALRADEAPEAVLLNRIVGLGSVEPATPKVLDSALDAMAGTRFYVSLDPDARPSALSQWLARRGLDPGWAWRQFLRGVEPLPTRPTQVRLTSVGAGEAEAYGRVVASCYELPEETVPLLANLHETGWKAWLALVGGEPAGAAAIYVEGDGAYLGFAATLPQHRGKGAQTALLATRIAYARAAGCSWLATETGERRAGSPSNSYRNLLRAGFEEQHLIDNWIGHG